jgi:hypothetical protein
MAAKEDAEHIPYFPFIPIRSAEDPDARGYRIDLIRVGLDSDARLMCDGEEIVDDL